MTEEGLLEITSTTSKQIDIISFCNFVHRQNGFKKETEFESPTSETEVHSNEKTSNGFQVIITIPAYNEEKTIGKVISNIKNMMDNTKYSFNYLVLVVNDGSTDETFEEAQRAGAFVFSHKENMGLAETFRTEMNLCCNLGAEIIVHTDADGQYKAEEIPLLIKEVENGYDLVLGSRFKGTIVNMSLIKKFGNRAFSVVLSILTKKLISDGQTGFRAFTWEVAEMLPIISTHTYTQEQIIRATQMKYSIKEVPIFFAKRDDGKSRLMKNPFEYAFNAWINILKIYFKKK